MLCCHSVFQSWISSSSTTTTTTDRQVTHLLHQTEEGVGLKVMVIVVAIEVNHHVRHHLDLSKRIWIITALSTAVEATSLLVHVDHHHLTHRQQQQQSSSSSSSGNNGPMAIVAIGERTAEESKSASSVEVLDWNILRQWWKFPSLNMARCGCAVNGARTGVGQMHYTDGDYFEGRFINDNREGVGTYVYHRDKRIYRGLYVADRQHDTKGVMIWKDGTIYSGAFVQGKRSGKGMISFPKSNVRYEGQLLEGKYHGRGFCTFGDDSFYDGDWNCGKAHGNGILVNCFGEIVHEGQWFNDGPVISSSAPPTSFPISKITH